MGMRQRRGGGGINGDGGRVGGGYYYGGGGGLSTIPIAEQEEEEKIHTKIQMRQQKRQTQQRLEEAQEAETMLGELGQMFGKMSTLISQQGEVLEKIEDDAELALTDVTAGQEELTKLYGLKKGNRPLIIKTFLILNFLIIFMKAYSKR
jgi:syntaxin 5